MVFIFDWASTTAPPRHRSRRPHSRHRHVVLNVFIAPRLDKSPPSLSPRAPLIVVLDTSSSSSSSSSSSLSPPLSSSSSSVPPPLLPTLPPPLPPRAPPLPPPPPPSPPPDPSLLSMGESHIYTGRARVTQRERERERTFAGNRGIT